MTNISKLPRSLWCVGLMIVAIVHATGTTAHAATMPEGTVSPSVTCHRLFPSGNYYIAPGVKYKNRSGKTQRLALETHQYDATGKLHYSRVDRYQVKPGKTIKPGYLALFPMKARNSSDIQVVTVRVMVNSVQVAPVARVDAVGTCPRITLKAAATKKKPIDVDVAYTTWGSIKNGAKKWSAGPYHRLVVWVGNPKYVGKAAKKYATVG